MMSNYQQQWINATSGAKHISLTEKLASIPQTPRAQNNSSSTWKYHSKAVPHFTHCMRFMLPKRRKHISVFLVFVFMPWWRQMNLVFKGKCIHTLGKMINGIFYLFLTNWNCDWLSLREGGAYNSVLEAQKKFIKNSRRAHELKSYSTFQNRLEWNEYRVL